MWLETLKYDPIPLLIAAENIGLRFLVGRDLCGKDMASESEVWNCRFAQQILKKQAIEGYWHFKERKPGTEFGENYALVETWKMLRLLVGKYSFNRQHPAIQRAVEFVFSCQTAEGDIRGILSNQYTPYYQGVILELLIHAGYGEDERVLRGLDWLLGMRQDDGGWIIPLSMYKMSAYYELAQKAPILPDRQLPFSHMTTGMVLRGLCVHHRYRMLPQVQQAGELLASRLFKKDTFSFRQAEEYWYKLQYPFWWTTLLSALDCLAWLGFTRDDARIARGLEWFYTHQQPSGSWISSYDGTDPETDSWVTLAVCCMLKKFLG